MKPTQHDPKKEQTTKKPMHDTPNQTGTSHKQGQDQQRHAQDQKHHQDTNKGKKL